MELFCFVGNFSAFKAVIENGVDVVYIGLKDDINVRYFVGFNFIEKKL